MSNNHYLLERAMLLITSTNAPVPGFNLRQALERIRTIADNALDGVEPLYDHTAVRPVVIDLEAIAAGDAAFYKMFGEMQSIPRAVRPVSIDTKKMADEIDRSTREIIKNHLNPKVDWKAIRAEIERQTMMPPIPRAVRPLEIDRTVIDEAHHAVRPVDMEELAEHAKCSSTVQEMDAVRPHSGWIEDVSLEAEELTENLLAARAGNSNRYVHTIRNPPFRVLHAKYGSKGQHVNLVLAHEDSEVKPEQILNMWYPDSDNKKAVLEQLVHIALLWEKSDEGSLGLPAVRPVEEDGTYLYKPVSKEATSLAREWMLGFPGLKEYRRSIKGALFEGLHARYGKEGKPLTLIVNGTAVMPSRENMMHLHYPSVEDKETVLAQLVHIALLWEKK